MRRTAAGWATFVRRLKTKSWPTVIPSCANLSDTASAENCTKSRRCPNYGRPGSGPKLKPGMTLAIEPMVNMGGRGVRVLDDKWTVVTSTASLLPILNTPSSSPRANRKSSHGEKRRY